MIKLPLGSTMAFSGGSESTPVVTIEHVVKTLSTRFLRDRKDTTRLTPKECKALLIVGRLGGLFDCTSEVSLLLPFLLHHVCMSKRPVLLLPARVIKPLREDTGGMSKTWIITPALHMISYETLSHKGHAQDLEHFLPDMIMCLKSEYLLRPAVKQRMSQYMKAHPTTKFVAMGAKDTPEFEHVREWVFKGSTRDPRVLEDE